MKNLILTLFISFFLLCICFGCKSEKSKTKILVLGDVQLKGTIKKFNKSEWENQSMDIARFKESFNTVIERERPDYIFQTGDWVNYNNNFFLSIVDTLGNELHYLSLPYDEWEVMNAQIPKSLKGKFYITMGNHESYGKVVMEGVFLEQYDILANIAQKEITLNKPNTKRKQLITRFPHLENASFHKTTGTYFTENNQFALLSVDGIDKDRDKLIAFIENQLKRLREEKPNLPLVVMSHYPIFTGRDKSNDDSLVLSDIRTQLIKLFDVYNVAFFFSGHEHFYLRYNSKALQKFNLDQQIPKHTNYVTVSNFSNPYPRNFERASDNDYTKEDVVFFNGEHYSILEISNTKIDFITYALIDDNWKVIDQLSVKI